MHRHPLLATGVLFLGLVLSLGVGSAGADGITITSGYVVVLPGTEGAASMAVAGDNGFSFSSTLSRQSRVDARACGTELPCGAGAPIPLGATWSGLDLFGAVATLNGVTYPQVGGANSPNQLGFELTGTAIAPAFGAATALQVTAPFALAGTFSFGPDTTSPEITTLDLAGHGTATVGLVRGAGDLSNTWVYNGVRYDFGSSTVPTPEPASLLLLGSGLLVLARRRWRRSS